MCDTPIARITGCMSSLDYGYRSASNLRNTHSVDTRVNKLMLVSLCAESIKPVFEGDKMLQQLNEMHHM